MRRCKPDHLLSLAVLLLIPCVASALSEPVPITTWELEQSINDLFVDENQDIYVATSDGIVKIVQGSDIQSMSEKYATAVAVGPDGSIYQSHGTRIIRYDRDGNVIAEWNTQHPSGAFSRPSGIAILDDVVYVSDSSTALITQYTANGDRLLEWSTELPGDQRGSSPQAIVIDADGNIFVADERIKKFTPEGVFLNQWVDVSMDGSFLSPFDITLDALGNVFVAVGHEELVIAYTPEGRRLGQFSAFTYGLSIALDGEGNIYIADGSTLKKLGRFPPAFPPVRKPTILIHAAPVQRLACGQGPAAKEQVVTAVEVDPEIGGRNFVYLLVSPTLYVDSSMGGLTGLQVGIDYRAAGNSGSGIGVHGWNHCADLEFPQNDWPDPGSGNTITWAIDTCQDEEVVTAGYFYVTAYAKSNMSVIEFPPTGQAKVADCFGAEFEATPGLERSRLGWAYFGSSVGGCNPLLTPCSDTVPVRPTTWGQIKARYGN